MINFIPECKGFFSIFYAIVQRLSAINAYTFINLDLTQATSPLKLSSAMWTKTIRRYWCPLLTPMTLSRLFLRFMVTVKKSIGNHQLPSPTNFFPSLSALPAKNVNH